ncbi:MAG: PHP domain-containing protein [bacterium]|nr:PHP domain-containing protein [bacterium]
MSLPRVDYHVHTVYSGHAEPELTVRTVIEQAGRAGLEAVAVTEHAFYGAMGRANLEQISCEAARAGRDQPGLKVFVGMEADPDYSAPGRLSFEDFDRKDLKPVLVGMHAYPGLGRGWAEKLNFTRTDKLKVYRAWFDLMKKIVAHPLVDVLAHPGRLLTQNGVVEEFNGRVLKDFEDLFSGAGEYGKAIELNENMIARLSTERLRRSYKDVIRLGLAQGLKVSIGSDAHAAVAIGSYSNVLALIEDIGLSSEQLYHPYSTGAAV